MDSFDETMPTDETLTLLSIIHDIQFDSTEIIEKIELFEDNQIKLSPVEIFSLLSNSSRQLKAQNKLIQKLVEHQLALDERLQEFMKQL